MKMIIGLSLLNFITIVAGDSLGWVNNQTDCNIDYNTFTKTAFIKDIFKFFKIIDIFWVINMAQYRVILKSKHAWFVSKYESTNSVNIWIKVF